MHCSPIRFLAILSLCSMNNRYLCFFFFIAAIQISVLAILTRRIAFSTTGMLCTSYALCLDLQFVGERSQRQDLCEWSVSRGSSWNYFLHEGQLSFCRFKQQGIGSVIRFFIVRRLFPPRFLFWTIGRESTIFVKPSMPSAKPLMVSKLVVLYFCLLFCSWTKRPPLFKIQFIVLSNDLLQDLCFHVFGDFLVLVESNDQSSLSFFQALCLFCFGFNDKVVITFGTIFISFIKVTIFIERISNRKYFISLVNTKWHFLQRNVYLWIRNRPQNNL